MANKTKEEAQGWAFLVPLLLIGGAWWWISSAWKADKEKANTPVTGAMRTDWRGSLKQLQPLDENLTEIFNLLVESGNIHNPLIIKEVKHLKKTMDFLGRNYVHSGISINQGNSSSKRYS